MRSDPRDVLQEANEAFESFCHVVNLDRPVARKLEVVEAAQVTNGLGYVALLLKAKGHDNIKVEGKIEKLDSLVTASLIELVEYRNLSVPSILPRKFDVNKEKQKIHSRMKKRTEEAKRLFDEIYLELSELIRYSI